MRDKSGKCFDEYRNVRELPFLDGQAIEMVSEGFEEVRLLRKFDCSLFVFLC